VGGLASMAGKGRILGRGRYRRMSNLVYVRDILGILHASSGVS